MDDFMPMGGGRMTQIDTATIRAIVRPHGATLAQITAQVSQATGISVADIHGNSRDRHIARARQVVMYQAGQAGAPLSAIGRHLNRDHTTVLHGQRRIAKLIEEGATWQDR